MARSNGLRQAWINVISNNYGLGEDDLFVPDRKRIHTDDSIEVKYLRPAGQTPRQDGVSASLAIWAVNTAAA